MTLDEQIEILQAAREGKEIEFLYKKPNEWLTKNLKEVPTFNFQDGKYRIKKQPKKVYLYVLKNDDNLISQTSFYLENEQQVKKRYPCWTIIKRLDYTELVIDE